VVKNFPLYLLFLYSQIYVGFDSSIIVKDNRSKYRVATGEYLPEVSFFFDREIKVIYIRYVGKVGEDAERG
jgi:hypothetical protein